MPRRLRTRLKMVGREKPLEVMDTRLPDLEFDVHGLMAMIMSRASLSAPGPDDFRFAHMASLLATTVR